MLEWGFQNRGPHVICFKILESSLYKLPKGKRPQPPKPKLDISFAQLYRPLNDASSKNPKWRFRRPSPRCTARQRVACLVWLWVSLGFCGFATRSEGVWDSKSVLCWLPPPPDTETLTPPPPDGRFFLHLDYFKSRVGTCNYILGRGFTIRRGF